MDVSERIRIMTGGVSKVVSEYVYQRVSGRVYEGMCIRGCLRESDYLAYQKTIIQGIKFLIIWQLIGRRNNSHQRNLHPLISVVEFSFIEYG